MLGGSHLGILDTVGVPLCCERIRMSEADESQDRLQAVLDTAVDGIITIGRGKPRLSRREPDEDLSRSADHHRSNLPRSARSRGCLGSPNRPGCRPGNRSLSCSTRCWTPTTCQPDRRNGARWRTSKRANRFTRPGTSQSPSAIWSEPWLAIHRTRLSRFCLNALAASLGRQKRDLETPDVRLLNNLDYQGGNLRTPSKR